MFPSFTAFSTSQVVVAGFLTINSRSHLFFWLFMVVSSFFVAFHNGKSTRCWFTTSWSVGRSHSQLLQKTHGLRNNLGAQYGSSKEKTEESEQESFFRPGWRWSSGNRSVASGVWKEVWATGRHFGHDAWEGIERRATDLSGGFAWNSRSWYCYSSLGWTRCMVRTIVEHDCAGGRFIKLIIGYESWRRKSTRGGRTSPHSQWCTSCHSSSSSSCVFFSYSPSGCSILRSLEWNFVRRLSKTSLEQLFSSHLGWSETWSINIDLRVYFPYFHIIDDLGATLQIAVS